MSNKKQETGKDYSSLLIWSAALVTVVRYAAAFVVSDSGQLDASWNGVMEFAMLLSGLGMGILDVIGGTYLFTGWQKKMPKNGDAWSFKFKVLTTFTIGLIINGIMILVPFTISRLAQISMFEVLGSNAHSGWLIGWAMVVNVAPYLLIAGVAVGNQVVTVNAESSAESYRQVTEEERKVSDKFPRGWRKVRKDLSPDQVRGIAVSTAKDIAYHYQIDERTARNWRKYAGEEVEKAKV